MDKLSDMVDGPSENTAVWPKASSVVHDIPHLQLTLWNNSQSYSLH